MSETTIANEVKLYTCDRCGLEVRSDVGAESLKAWRRINMAALHGSTLLSILAAGIGGKTRTICGGCVAAVEATFGKPKS